MQPYIVKIQNYTDKYHIEDCIYSQSLTPTSIFQAVDKQSGERVVIKEIKKNKLVASYMHEFAKNELALHYSLSNYTYCENIVKTIDYFENEMAYYLIMECSPEPNFLDELLETVNSF